VLLEDQHAASDQLVATAGTLHILYEDDDILLIDKPAGLPVHPSPGHYSDTLANILLWHYSQKGQGLVVRTIGRLDKSTSGLLLVAKNAPAQTQLERQRAKGILKRRYMALVEGTLSPPKGRVEAPIGNRPGSLMEREVREDGASAVTDYETVMAGKDYSLVKIMLHTGRTHQIRVHMAYLGHPLLGDFLYGRENPALIPRAALHSAQLDFIHPATGRPMHLEAELPPDMAHLIQQGMN
jgi:23S rRNA pseudouridine1911/1915/1917 synthase